MVGGQLQPYALPRLGFDGFVIDGLSIGGTLGIYTASLEDNDATAFLVAPRVGYATYFSDSVGIWPRGGFSLYSLKLSNDNANGDVTTRYFAFDVEAPFLFNLADWLAIHAGPTIDVSLSGSREVDTRGGDVEIDMSLFSFGLAAGITGFIP
ncbi:MAG: outer membrane beta-barrel protein [Deltaproteobacteria bacterium]|nr:outer membrane beta-barrel protein [Deltaproteobacteria bacterium]